MDEERPKHTPGPYHSELIPGSKDVSLYSVSTGEAVARVLTKESGHRDAPPDDAALYNAGLLAAAPDMRAALEVVLEREFEPMHPLIAQSIRGLLAYVDEGRHGAIELQRRIDEIRQELNEENEDEDLGHSY